MDEITESMTEFAAGAASARDEWDWEPNLVRSEARHLVQESTWRELEAGEQGFIWQVMEFDQVTDLSMLR